MPTIIKAASSAGGWEINPAVADGAIVIQSSAANGTNVVNALIIAADGQISTLRPLGLALQVVNFQTGAMATGTTLIPLDDTVPQITEGTQFMQLAITPTSSSSRLKIDVVTALSYNADAVISVALFRDSTANALASNAVWSSGGSIRNISVLFSHFMTSGTTSTITFRVRAGGDNPGTLTFNGRSSAPLYGGTLASSMTITEYAA